MVRSRLLKEVTSLEGRRFIIVSNRQPFAHVRHLDEVRIEKPPSGLTLALEPIVQATKGTWVASSSGSADAEFVDERGHVQSPPGVNYTLRRLFLPRKLHEDFYTGFANSTLWPLCHIAYRKPRFEERWWQAYQHVNRLFLEAIADEIGDAPAIVFVQDFHLALLPRMVKERCPQAVVAQFWHIPWPNPEAFRICPWRSELLDGLLGNDLLGFHVPYHCNNFLETVDRELSVRIDREHNDVISAGHSTGIASFPMSIDYGQIRATAFTPERLREAEELRRRYGQGRKMILSVERMDYSKGILERMDAIHRLFERHPDLKEKVNFVHIATPSRTTVRAYRDYANAVEHAIVRVNGAHSTPSWKPVTALHTYVEPEKVWTWYHAADAVIVSSLHDGMNLVAKEFVAAGREDALLLLSEFTGAARELREAITINPYATDSFADSMAAAMAMSGAERRERMRRLRWRVSNNDIGTWAREILRAIRQHEFDATNSTFQFDPTTGTARLDADAPQSLAGARRKRL